MKKYLCIDVGGGSIKYALLDETLKFYDRGEVKTPYEDTKKYISVLEEIYKRYEDQAEGIALAVPGMIDSENGICISGGSLEYVENFAIVEELEKCCHVRVTVMNDAKAAALAESRWGALSDCDDAVVVVFGTGIGGALIKDKKVHMGKHFSAGEFSWIMMQRDGDIQNELWCMRNGRERLSLLAASVRGANKAETTGRDVFCWIEEGDKRVLAVLDEFTKDIAWMILNLQAIYDPEKIAIGGGISQQPILLEYINKNLEYYYSLHFPMIPRAKVVNCKYFNDANLIGALGYHLETL